MAAVMRVIVFDGQISEQGARFFSVKAGYRPVIQENLEIAEDMDAKPVHLKEPVKKFQERSVI